MLRVAWLGTYVETQHDDFEDVVGQGMIDLVHDQRLALGEMRLSLDWGITKRFGVSAMLPVRVVSADIRYLAASDGSEVELVTPGVHHRDETLTGLVDPMVLGGYTTALGPVRLVLRAGVSLPLGRTEENPFTPEAEVTPHQHVQMGTGTINPIVSADVQWTRGPWSLGGFVFTQQVFYENGKGYEAGDRYATGVSLGRRLSPAWSVRGGLELQGETAERWNGMTYTDDGNRGRVDAMVTAGGSWNMTPEVALEATLKVPFVTHAVGGQLDIPAIFELGASWRFGAKAPPRREAEDHDHAHGDEHDHAHGDAHADEHADEHGDEHDAAHAHDADAHADEHGDEHGHADGEASADGDAHAHGDAGDRHGASRPDTADRHGASRPDTSDGVRRPDPRTPAPPTPDVADFNKPGEAPDLVPVRGKLTIFDFWATWCQPCKTLDPALVELARTYPHVVAIRKLDVVDWDSKAAERYLTPGGFDLPHLKIYDPSGKRILEKSSAKGKLQALIDEVRRLVEAEAAKRPAPKPAARTTPTPPRVAPKPAPTTSAAPARTAPKLATATSAPTRVEVKVLASGFAPANVRVRRGARVTLVFERTVERTCATEVIFTVAGERIAKPLPLGQRVEITTTFPERGTVTYACAMDMIRGTITVE